MYYLTSFGGVSNWNNTNGSLGALDSNEQFALNPVSLMGTQASYVGIGAHCVVAALVTLLVFELLRDKDSDDDSGDDDDVPVDCLDSNDTNDTNCPCDSNDTNDTNCPCDSNDSNNCDSNGVRL